MSAAPPDLDHPPANTPGVEPSPLLAGKMMALRRRHVLVAVLTGLAMIVVVCVELLALEMFIDWWLDLPWGMRLVLLLGQSAVFVVIFLRMVAAPLLRKPD